MGVGEGGATNPGKGKALGSTTPPPPEGPVSLEVNHLTSGKLDFLSESSVSPSSTTTTTTRESVEWSVNSSAPLESLARGRPTALGVTLAPLRSAGGPSGEWSDPAEGAITLTLSQGWTGRSSALFGG